MEVHPLLEGMMWLRELACGENDVDCLICDCNIPWDSFFPFLFLLANDDVGDELPASRR